ncbi:MAG: hypothetical protein IIA45_08395 [Bacteroidetes bacterium]|nr:hypothetical protein [Bacteroidota bacterium]
MFVASARTPEAYKLVARDYIVALLRIVLFAFRIAFSAGLAPHAVAEALAQAPEALRKGEAGGQKVKAA